MKNIKKTASFQHPHNIDIHPITAPIFSALSLFFFPPAAHLVFSAPFFTGKNPREWKQTHSFRRALVASDNGLPMCSSCQVRCNNTEPPPPPFFFFFFFPCMFRDPFIYYCHRVTQRAMLQKHPFISTNRSRTT